MAIAKNDLIKYPNQVCSSKRRTKTLGVDVKLWATTSEETGQSPLEMHSNYSVFTFSILDVSNPQQKVSVKANLHCSEIWGLLDRSKVAIQNSQLCKLIAPQIQQQSSGNSDNTTGTGPAYTVKITSGNLKGKTPAEVLFENPNNTTGLVNQMNWLSSNLAKYPRNQEQIDAINHVLSLQKEGKLVQPTGITGGSSSQVIIHSDEIKIPSIKKLENGMTFVYSFSVVYDPNMTYPVNINIMNCYAPPVYGNGTSQVSMERATRMSKISFAMSEREWLKILHRMRMTVELFEQHIFSRQYEIYKANIWSPDDGNSSKQSIQQKQGNINTGYQQQQWQGQQTSYPTYNNNYQGYQGYQQPQTQGQQVYTQGYQQGYPFP